MDTLSLRAISAKLHAECLDDASMSAWLDPSWHDSATFFAELDLELLRRLPLAFRMRPDVGVDLFTSCVLAHAASSAVALTERVGTRWRETSFSGLCEASLDLSGSWRAAGLSAGACVAVALPIGRDYLVALLAALHIGAVAAPIPPQGRTYLRRRLAQLAPDFVVIATQHEHWLPKNTPLLTFSGPRAAPGRSHVYDPDAPVLRVLSAFRTFDAEPVELSASALQRALLRDGLLVYALRAGEPVVMPGFDPLQLQPLAILTALYMGATWVELSEPEAVADPSLLAVAKGGLLGVTRALREQLQKLGEASLPQPRAWLRLLNETYDFNAWEAFRARMVGRSCPSFAVLPSAASSGVLLATQPAQTAQPSSVWPRAGERWLLSQVGSDGFESWHDSGVFTPLRYDAKQKKYLPDVSAPRVVLTKQGVGWSFAGTVDQWPDGRALPLSEIGRIASQHPRVGAAAALITPGRWANEGHLTVGLFVPTDHPEGKVEAVAQLRDEVSELLRVELGQACVPERSDVFPLYPRRKGDAIDLDWFRTQYLSGALFRRAREPLFVATAQLAWAFDPPFAARSAT